MQTLSETSETTVAVDSVTILELGPDDYLFDVDDDDLDSAGNSMAKSPHTIFTMKQLGCRC